MPKRLTEGNVAISHPCCDLDRLVRYEPRVFIALVNIPHNSSQASVDADTEFPCQSLTSVVDGNQDDFFFMLGEAPFKLEGVVVKAAYSGPLGIQEV